MNLRSTTRRTTRSRLLVALASLACGYAVDARAAGPEQVPQGGPAALPPGFAIESVPVSDVPLSAFPFIRLPDGYEWGDNGKGETRDFDRFPF